MKSAAQIVPREVMDIRQAAAYLGISADSLYRYASEGVVPAFKLGNRWRFKRDLLDRWMERESGVIPEPASPEAKKPARSAR
ncbi:helix-turn-helix domain-containing protein [Terriglobus aquaticus]|uniref:Helix-turn-helix domain-containing protein n=1 Tax=Terriglobus aquaticus TaxID=940139 RepID=A0ABW9KJI1_9BACT|nr:helix-turn-helix domain-containing protein [Terriglobus aquaticus]